MIPKEIGAIETVVSAQFYQCLLELFSTNHKDAWILQLRHEQKGNSAFLFDGDNLAALCLGLKECIDSTLNKFSHVRANMVLNTVASHLSTNLADQGAITIIGSWEKEPNIQFNFYPDAKLRGSRITLGYLLEDAMKLYNMFAVAYNKREIA
jgi:hypothetical protein